MIGYCLAVLCLHDFACRQSLKKTRQVAPLQVQIPRSPSPSVIEARACSCCFAAIGAGPGPGRLLIYIKRERSSTAMGRASKFLEPTLIFAMRINVGWIDFQLMLQFLAENLLVWATFVVFFSRK